MIIPGITPHYHTPTLSMLTREIHDKEAIFDRSLALLHHGVKVKRQVLRARRPQFDTQLPPKLLFSLPIFFSFQISPLTFSFEGSMVARLLSTSKFFFLLSPTTVETIAG